MAVTRLPLTSLTTMTEPMTAPIPVTVRGPVNRGLDTGGSGCLGSAMSPDRRPYDTIRDRSPRAACARICVPRCKERVLPDDRSLDSAATRRCLASTIVRVAADVGISCVRLPSETGIRLGYVTSSLSEPPTELLSGLESLGAVVTPVESTMRTNSYEFSTPHPLEGTAFTYHRVSPGSPGMENPSFLRRQWVSVEPLLTEGGSDDLIVPRAGSGPRRYRAEHLDILHPTGRDHFDIGRAPPFPIDLVTTWVDGQDPGWQRDFERAASHVDLDALPRFAANRGRWTSRSELRYSLRSVWMYAPFVRRIFVVTNGQRPEWLHESEQVRIVRHGEIFPDPTVLPTFNSRAIESVLHRIPDLAEHFIYLNDDFFFGRPQRFEQYFSRGGLTRHFRSKRHLDPDPPRPDDRATVVGHKRTRALLRERYGIESDHKFQHAPYCMRRSIWQRIEADCADELDVLRHARFRSWESITAVSFLYDHLAIELGHGDYAELDYAYAELEAGAPNSQVERVLNRSLDVFCINDADSEADDGGSGALEGLLARRFPVLPPWEDPSRSATSGS